MITRQIILFYALLASSAAFADDERTLYQSEPSTGTRIRQGIAYWAIPPKKTYEQLNNSERESVRGAYENLAAEDEPPYPQEGMAPMIKAVAELQQDLMWTGKMLLIIKVDETGKATSVQFDPTPPTREFAKRINKIFATTKFKPAKCSGQPCQMKFPVKIAFRIG